MKLLPALHPCVAGKRYAAYLLLREAVCRSGKPVPSARDGLAEGGVNVDIVLAQTEQATCLRLPFVGRGSLYRVIGTELPCLIRTASLIGRGSLLVGRGSISCVISMHLPLIIGEVRTVITEINLEERRLVRMIAELRRDGQQTVGILKVRPPRIDAVVHAEILKIQIHRERPSAESPRSSPAKTYRGGVDTQLIHRTPVLRLQRQHRRKCLPILQRSTARLQTDPAEHERRIASARRRVDSRRRVRVQDVHAVHVGLRLATASATHQQASAFALHLRTW